MLQHALGVKVTVTQNFFVNIFIIHKTYNNLLFPVKTADTQCDTKRHRTKMLLTIKWVGKHPKTKDNDNDDLSEAVHGEN